MQQYNHVSYGLGFETGGLLLENVPPIKCWRGGRGWRFVPKFLWGLLRRPYELKTFEQCMREAGDKLAREMEEFTMRMLRDA